MIQVIQGLAVILLFSSFLHPARITFWTTTTGEYDLMVKGDLGINHDRTCGIVTQDQQLWDSMTFKSGGARVGIAKTGLPLDAAKLAVEQDCR